MELWRGHITRIKEASQKLPDLQGDLRKRHFSACGSATIVKGKNGTPFENGSLQTISFDIETPPKEQIAFETWSCKGTNSCTLVHNDKRFPCAFSVTIQHFPTFSVMIGKGTHGSNFVPGDEPLCRRGLTGPVSIFLTTTTTT